MLLIEVIKPFATYRVGDTRVVQPSLAAAWERAGFARVIRQTTEESPDGLSVKDLPAPPKDKRIKKARRKKKGGG